MRPRAPSGAFFISNPLTSTHSLMDTDQPVIPLGFPERTGAYSGRRIDVQVPLYQTMLNTLHVTLPVHYLALTSDFYPVTPQQSRERLVSPFSLIAWPQLESHLDMVFEHRGYKLRGAPSAEDWQREKEALRLAHIKAYTGY